MLVDENKTLTLKASVFETYIKTIVSKVEKYRAYMRAELGDLFQVVGSPKVYRVHPYCSHICTYTVINVGIQLINL